jgi:8-oxo-dGTP pyrophosphatase MutT (NUDIX family)
VTHRFDSTFRSLVAQRCAGFRRRALAGNAQLKHAAVALVLADAGDGRPAFLLTERPGTMRNHAGQYALPGGRCDAGETALEAALREVEEEIGLVLSPADVLGTLDDYETRSGYLVTPIVVWAERSAPLTLSAEEVADVHRIPVEGFVTPETVNFVSIAESPRPVIRIQLMGHHLHAPTAAIVYQFCELIAGREVRVAEFEQPLFAWR